MRDRLPRYRRVRAAAALLAAMVTGPVFAGAAPAAAETHALIVLPDASSAEGIAKGTGATFYAGDLLRGDIFRGDLQRGTADLLIDAPDGRLAVGMSFDARTGLLFVAGGPGAAYVYDTRTGATVAAYALADPAGSFVNDVTITRDAAWFTDSFQPRLHVVPLDGAGSPGPARSLALSGPAAQLTGPFNLNGIAATPDGSTLVVAHSADGALYTVDPVTGASAPIAGVSVPNVDGIVLEAGRIWAVRNEDNAVVRIRPAPDLRSGSVEATITDPAFQTPTTAARFGDRLAVVNAKFDTGFPPTADRYEVVIVDR